FSSRRRHTRWPRDWSSDVCSSDLITFLINHGGKSGKKWYQHNGLVRRAHADINVLVPLLSRFPAVVDFKCDVVAFEGQLRDLDRSEERRVGKEWIIRVWWE